MTDNSVVMGKSYEKEIFSKNAILRRYFSGSGRPIPIENIHHVVPALISALRRKISNEYMDAPFIPFEAIHSLDRVVQSTMKVVEIGAGMSTIWLGRRAKSVISYEWNDEWYGRVIKMLGEKGISNVELIKNVGHENMSFDRFKDYDVDMIFVDGGPRSMSLINLWPKLKSGGLAYLDNWDSDLFWSEGGYDARAFISNNSTNISNMRLFVDYVPGYVNVSEGILLQKM